MTNNNNQSNLSKPSTPGPISSRPSSPSPATFSPSAEFVKALGMFFQREVIAIPLVKRINHNSTSQRCGLKGTTLELDTACYPNLDYIAGNRLSIYPTNPMAEVVACMKFIVNDLMPQQTLKEEVESAAKKKARLSDPWECFVQLNGQESIKLALLHVYDIMTAPSRDFMRVLGTFCSNKEHKAKAMAISSSDESWEKWVCSNLRTLKTTFEEFNSCQMPAKVLFAELTLQQPRQYSISNIKSRKRFRTEIVVIQHRFSTKQIAITLQNIKEREANEKSIDKGFNENKNADLNHDYLRRMRSHPTSVRVGNNEPNRSARSSASIRSLRSVATFGSSPISTQQVSKLPTYSGKLMSLYASSKSSLGATSGLEGAASSNLQLTQKNNEKETDGKSNSTSLSGPFHDGLCSNYLLNVAPNEYIICEFVENPRFTLKGNRERPIMMIGQAIGTLAFRAFWQQRALEQDRAQMFYTLFKDLSPKKFGDLHLVNLTGNKCKIEELFRKEVNSNVEHKVMSSVIEIDKKYLQQLIESTVSSTLSQSNQSVSSMSLSPAHRISSKVPTSPRETISTLSSKRSKQVKGTAKKQATQQANQQLSGQMRAALYQKDLFELGNKLSRLLMDNNGCLYTCCDLQMTQAIEILIVESVVRNHPNYDREQIISMLTKWKGNTLKYQHQILQGIEGKKYLFTLENPFERAQIVQEIYDETL